MRNNIIVETRDFASLQYHQSSKTAIYLRNLNKYQYYERCILSFWLTKINPTITGITTIALPQTRLQRKFAKEGVINSTFCYTLHFNSNRLLHL